MADQSNMSYESTSSESSHQPRYYCHQCFVEVDINQSNDELTCKRCSGTFIELLENDSHGLNSSRLVENPDDDYVGTDQTFHDLLQFITGTFGPFMNEAAAPSAPASSSSSSSASAPTDPRLRRPRFRATFQNNSTTTPFQNMFNDFVFSMENSGQPLFFVGNPGDYAWGREGLDAIVTQLLNQMDGTGPPPLPTDKIKEIPMIKVSKEQADSNLQCSVCWENFQFDEEVRKLSCEHIFHTPCIDPWLQLHGTCPICRKTLHDTSGAAGSTTTAATSNTSSSTVNTVSSFANLLREAASPSRRNNSNNSDPSDLF